MTLQTPQSGSGQNGWGGFWNAVGTLGNAALGYLSAKDREKTARDIAKIQAQGGGSSAMNQILLQLLLSQQGGQTIPNWAPPIQGSTIAPQLSPSYGGPQMTAPYVQPPALSAGPITPWGPPSLLQNTPVPQVGGGGVMMTMPSYMTSGGGGIISAPQVFTSTVQGYRAKRFFGVSNPATGNLSWYRSAGRPILWSGDLGACKRVRKVAARARTASPRRRTTAKRR
jgi:hypothetical protein